jgi:hypothetical protein
MVVLDMADAEDSIRLARWRVPQEWHDAWTKRVRLGGRTISVFKEDGTQGEPVDLKSLFHILRGSDGHEYFLRPEYVDVQDGTELVPMCGPCAAHMDQSPYSLPAGMDELRVKEPQFEVRF